MSSSTFHSTLPKTTIKRGIVTIKIDGKSHSASVHDFKCFLARNTELLDAFFEAQDNVVQLHPTLPHE